MRDTKRETVRRPPAGSKSDPVGVISHTRISSPPESMSRHSSARGAERGIRTARAATRRTISGNSIWVDLSRKAPRSGSSPPSCPWRSLKSLAIRPRM